ncbi:hypothetical protein QCD79_35050, partial [Pseudomonas quasicaspiana]|nr:hypothetical protein [Pseudomonas quasicaspiana]
LNAYFAAACLKGGHTPHVLREALSWHARLDETGSMLPVSSRRACQLSASRSTCGVCPPLRQAAAK